MARLSFSRQDGLLSRSMASALAGSILYTQIALQIVFITIWLWFKQLSTTFEKAENLGDSRESFHGSRRQRCRPQHLDLLSIHKHRNSPADIVISNASPCPFKTPAVEVSAYDDPSVRIEARPSAVVNSTLSPQLHQFAQDLERQLGPLPSSWSIRLSTDSRIFFVNLQSGETTWCDPRLNTLGVIMSPVSATPPDDASRNLKRPPYLHTSPHPPHCRENSLEEIRTPILPHPPSAKIRIAHWVAEERSKIRARNARVNVLKCRSRMARMQRFTQPLVL